MKIAGDLLNFLRMVVHNGYMIRTMVDRDIRARYIGSFLGIFWSIIHPVIQIIIYYFVFSVVLKIKLGPEYGETNFAIWLVAGLLPWIFFAEVVSRSPQAVLEQASLISKTVFPSEVLSLTHLLSAIINHMIGVFIFIIFLLLLGHGVNVKIFFIFPFLLFSAMFALGISWALSSLNVFFRDIGQIVGVFVNIWFFLTPIMYPRYLVPENLQALYGLNPMLYAIEGYRSAFLGSTTLGMVGIAYFLLISLSTFTLGGIIFKKLKPGFADVL
jgi:ABC-type polysaccharide/polyol phosphate export permease